MCQLPIAPFYGVWLLVRAMQFKFLQNAAACQSNRSAGLCTMLHSYLLILWILAFKFKIKTACKFISEHNNISPYRSSESMYGIRSGCGRCMHRRIHHVSALSHRTAVRPAQLIPPPAENSSWCRFPMAHTWLWALQSFPSCCTAGMGGSAGTCLWQASAFTLTLVSWGRLPGSQVTNANTHSAPDTRLKSRMHTGKLNLQNQEALKCDLNHLKSIGIIVREVLTSHVSLSDSKPCPDSGCGLEL